MDSQKNENLLNLALQTPAEERERSLELNVGYDIQEKTWEVIVKYHGSLQSLSGWGIMVEELIAGYAILTVPESEMERLSVVEQIEYVEKPKRLFFSDLTGNTASCFAPGSQISTELTGRGVLVAVIDSGERVIIWLSLAKKCHMHEEKRVQQMNFLSPCLSVALLFA